MTPDAITAPPAPRRAGRNRPPAARARRPGLGLGLAWALAWLGAAGAPSAFAQERAGPAPAAAAIAGTPQSLPTIRLTAGMHAITAQVAATPQQQETGLMFRRTMPANDGMLFAFEQPGMQCFWMKNTLLPLDVAFVADDGRIANLDTMQPQTLDNHCSTEPVRYVLEMNQGWFARRGIRPGMKLGGQPFRR